MTPERVKLLEEIGFCFDLSKENWWTRYQELVDFVEEHGHANVPSGYENKKLVSWVKVQRRWYGLYTKGLKQYPSDRIEALEKIGFQWRLSK